MRRWGCCDVNPFDKAPSNKEKGIWIQNISSLSIGAVSPTSSAFVVWLIVSVWSLMECPPRATSYTRNWLEIFYFLILRRKQEIGAGKEWWKNHFRSVKLIFLGQVSRRGWSGVGRLCKRAMSRSNFVLFRHLLFVCRLPPRHDWHGDTHFLYDCRLKN